MRLTLMVPIATTILAGTLAAQQPDSTGRLPRPDKKDANSRPLEKTGDAEETSLTIGGYIKLDVIDDLSGTIGNQYQFKTATIAVDDDDEDLAGRVTLNARESRVHADFRLKGHVRAFVEGDF